MGSVLTKAGKWGIIYYSIAFHAFYGKQQSYTKIRRKTHEENDPIKGGGDLP